MSKNKAKESAKKERSVHDEKDKEIVEEKNDLNAVEEVKEEQTAEQTTEETTKESEKAEPQEKIKELEEQVLSLKDQLLRKHADFENFKKRINKEKEDSIKYANQMLLLDLVAIIDDFERAIKSSEEAKDYDVFHSGIVMIENQLVSMLDKKWGLCRFNSLGEAFDPEKHQAIAMEESPDCDEPVVVEDYQKGYFFHERVLRPAKVKVNQPAASKPAEENKDA